MEFPYEGDLLAVVENVTVPRLVQETTTTFCAIVGVPDIRVQLDEILNDAWWSRRMIQRCLASR